ncbi:MAG: hypothetical protein JW891_12285 [Candidatus Lokiarchaeota archaeon]|nr:hypothetical protein [Candidatus Lokiarchaeota archaeon]
MSKNNIISKVVEIENCSKDVFLKALFKPGIWEKCAPVKKIDIEFISPNVFRSNIVDQVDVVNIPVELTGELVMNDKGEEQNKGRLIELNVRNNKDVQALEGRLRIKALSPTKTKIGVYIDNLKVTNDFMNLLGKNAAELVLRNKLTALLRNLENYCKTSDLKQLL